MTKVFQLKKKGWYMRLLKFMWDVDYEDFTHMCPVFWVTVISIILFIPWLILAGIGKGVIGIIDAYKSNARKKLKEKEDADNVESAALYEKILSDSEAKMNFAREVYMSWFEDGCMSRTVTLVHSYRMSEKERIDLNALVQIIAKEREEIRAARQLVIVEAYQKKQAAIIARKQRINKIIRQFKPLAKFVLWLLAVATILLAGWGIYKGVIALSKVPTKVWMAILLRTCFIITAFFLIFALSKVNWSFLSFRLSCKGKKRLRAFFGFIGTYIFGPFVWFFKGIVKIFVIGIQTIRNECPPVEWKD